MKPESIAHKTTLHILRAIFLLALLAIPGAIFAAFWVADVDSFKKYINDSGVYSVAGEIVANDVTKSVIDSTGNIGLAPESAKQTVDRVINPAFLRQKSEKIIGDNYEWLNGKRDSPVFDVSFAAEQRRLSEEIAKEAASQVLEKPECNFSQIMQYSEQLRNSPLAIPCRVPGADRAAIEGAVLKGAEDQLAMDAANTVAEGRQLGVAAGSQSSKGNSSEYIGASLKLIYWWVKHGLMVFISILLVSGAISLMVLKSIPQWIHWSKPAFLSAAITLYVAIIPIVLIAQTSLIRLPAQLNIFSAVISALATPLVIVTVSVATVYLILSIFAIIFGAKKRKVQGVGRESIEPAISQGGSGASSGTFGKPF